MKIIEPKTMSRRNFLRVGSLTVGAAVLLAACGEGGENDEDENEMGEEGEMEEDEGEDNDD